MALKKNERKSVSFRKVENGFIIRQETTTEKSNGEFKFDSKEFVSQSATEAKKMIDDLSKDL